VATLYLVSTPIGNLSDLSPRAADTLRSVHRILAEDTRRTRVLTEHVQSSVPLVSVHAHNERQRIERILGWLDAGEDLALVSDAGTPLVSDPGARVVEAVAQEGHLVVPIPGASAVLAALVASGLPTDQFVFLGFPQRKGKERKKLMGRVATSEETVVLFESPRRLVPLLKELVEQCGPERRAAVARELTKVHEEVTRGTLEELLAYYSERSIKGEVSVVIEPASDTRSETEREAEAVRLAGELLKEGMKPSAAAREVASRLGLGRNDAYRIVHDFEGVEADE
jgi:16S rRNA (cytidine1402-2'-O)-methyltransferase